MGLKDLLGDYQVKRASKKGEYASHKFPNALLKPKHVLVCLPAGLRELTLVKSFLPTITQLFKPADISLLSMPGIRVNDIYPRKGFQILTPTVEQMTWAGLPKKSYIEHLQAFKFDTVIDLSLESSRFVATILLGFPDAIRIGRGNHLGDPFYNLEIKTKYLRDERNIYRSLLETLATIMNKNIGSTSGYSSR
jgi:hypothetical protein